MRTKNTRFLILFSCFFFVHSTIKAQDTLRIQDTAKDVGTVDILQSKLKDKQRESLVTVESIGIQSIKETPASDFYEGLGHLRGVDVTAASLGFRVVNTRGFNSTSPVRSLQLIDGVDNQAPGLNFSLGNFLGASELDVAGVDIVVGAAGAFYGPNAFNGAIVMQSKSAWKHTGFSAQVKVGERDLGQIMLRYAQKFANKKGREAFAFKLNFFYLRAYDWVAGSEAPSTESKVGKSNPGGYDAVNRYGDENLGAGTNDASSRGNRVTVPGLMIYHRDGYWEKDLVNYQTRNVKSNILLAYKPNRNNELQYAFNFGTGTTVYQGDNRYSLNNILFFQNRLEWIHKNGYLRLYSTNEDAGNTYDAVYTAFLMQRHAKADGFWSSDYYNYWLNHYTNRVRALPGYPRNPQTNPNFFKEQDAVFEKYRDSLVKWHQITRGAANGDKDYQGLPRIDPMYNRYEPGTEEFNQLKKEVTSRMSYSRDGAASGSRFFDRSALIHLTGDRKYKYKLWKFRSGFSSRVYLPNSQGTIFLDTGKPKITNWEIGGYGGVETRLFKNKWIWSGTVRVDKNQNFDVLFSPATTLIYLPDKRNSWRMSFNSAIRNPTLQDQYLYYNVGRAILLGNINGINNVLSVDNLIDFLNTQNRDTLKYFNIDPIRPEKVKSIEIGYKGFLFDDKLSVDAGGYFSYYKDFIGYKVVVDAEIDTSLNRVTRAQAYRVATNSVDAVNTFGISMGSNYYFSKFYTLGFNLSYNQLDRRGSADPIIPAFNTPRHKLNISFGASTIDKSFTILGKIFHVKNVGFNINHKWIEGFLFEGSPQFTGRVPGYSTTDVQFSFLKTRWDAILKVGASNVFNNQVIQVYGGPIIGRMAYISLTYEPK